MSIKKDLASIEAHKETMKALGPYADQIGGGNTVQPPTEQLHAKPYDWANEATAVSIPGLEARLKQRPEEVRNLRTMVKDLGIACVHLAKVAPAEGANYLAKSERWRNSRVRRIGLFAIRGIDAVAAVMERIADPEQAAMRRQERILEKADEDAQKGKGTVIYPFR